MTAFIAAVTISPMSVLRKNVPVEVERRTEVAQEGMLSMSCSARRQSASQSVVILSRMTRTLSFFR